MTIDLRSILRTTEQPELDLGSSDELNVVVIRSTRRTKTAQARLVGTTLEVRIPARLSKTEEREMVEYFRSKFERSRQTSALDLQSRAALLCSRYDLEEPGSIRWVSNQVHRWGSCTPDDRAIRISDRLVGFPDWVLDYVIVHELAHLVEFGHTPRFWEIVERYPLAERARGFLIAKGWEG
jgi:predicted metal-dependent hydrolase